MTVANGVRAAADASLDASEPLSGTIRYYRGQGASQLSAETRAFARVTRRNVYQGIDLVYYGNQRRLEYDFVVAPGRDPRVIGLEFSGADRLEIEPASGDLLLHVPGGEAVRQHKPITYQVIGTALIYSTYLGGSENDNINEHVLRLAADVNGNAHVVGSTYSPNFPVTANADSPQFSAGNPNDTMDGYYTKLSAAGALVYSSYIGGSKTDYATGVDVDAAGNAYVSGVTMSAAADGFTLPANAFDATLNGFRDYFILKFDAAGTKVYGTYVGGNGSSD